MAAFAGGSIATYHRLRLDWRETFLHRHFDVVASIAVTRDGSSLVSAGDERVLYWPNFTARSAICVNANPSDERG